MKELLIKKSLEKLADNGVIAFPTDTLYGIAARINSEKAYNKIFDIKKRVETFRLISK